MASLPIPTSELSVPILVASANLQFQEQILNQLCLQHLPRQYASGGAEALEKIEQGDCRMVIVDRKIPDLNAEELVKQLREHYPGVEVILADGVFEAEELEKKPVRKAEGSGHSEELRALSQIRSQIASNVSQEGAAQEATLSGVIGDSPEMMRLARLVRLVAPRNSTVLLCGPTGTGKELVASSLHELSQRSSRPFVPINCAAIPEGKGNGKLRDLTEIENEILESVLKVICRELESAWEPLEMKLAFDSRQAPSQVQRIMPPNEKVLVLSFEVKMPDVRGNLNFAFPSAFSTALLKKLAKHWEYQKPHTTEQDGSRMRDLLQDCQFLLELGVECDRVPVRQLVSLKVGDIVKLPHSIRHPAKVFVAGKPMFEASPVRIGEGKGAQIMQLSPDPKAEANREKAFA